MDLLLWRHAEAEEGRDDPARRLTPKGMRQAARMAAWLDAHIAKEALVLVSPAQRARQTAQPLSRKTHTSDAVNVGAAPAAVLDAAGWPASDGTVVVVGHQPTLGGAAALALTGTATPWRIRKGSVWWIRSSGDGSPMVVAVLAPDLL